MVINFSTDFAGVLAAGLTIISQEPRSRMFSKLRSVLLVAAATPLLITAQAPAIPPAKVAIINAQKAVADTQEMKKTQAALEAKYRPRTQQIQSLQNEIQSIQQQLNTPNQPPDKEAQLRADGTLKQK